MLQFASVEVKDLSDEARFYQTSGFDIILGTHIGFPIGVLNVLP